jgi:hypothetical protein
VPRPAWWCCSPVCTNQRPWGPGSVIVSWTRCDLSPVRAIWPDGSGIRRRTARQRGAGRLGTSRDLGGGSCPVWSDTEKHCELVRTILSGRPACPMATGSPCPPHGAVKSGLKLAGAPAQSRGLTHCQQCTSRLTGPAECHRRQASRSIRTEGRRDGA